VLINVNDFPINRWLLLCMEIKFMFRHGFIKSNDINLQCICICIWCRWWTKTTQKGCKYKLLTEGSTGFQ
jgi:hypothetical protein